MPVYRCDGWMVVQAFQPQVSFQLHLLYDILYLAEEVNRVYSRYFMPAQDPEDVDAGEHAEICPPSDVSSSCGDNGSYSMVDLPFQIQV
jgi:hypothetical protein